MSLIGQFLSEENDREDSAVLWKTKIVRRIESEFEGGHPACLFSSPCTYFVCLLPRLIIARSPFVDLSLWLCLLIVLPIVLLVPLHHLLVPAAAIAESSGFVPFPSVTESGAEYLVEWQTR